MDDELIVRSVASICGALTVLAEAAQEPKPGRDHLQQGLAYADCWVESIMRGGVTVKDGRVSFAREGP